MRVRIGLLCLMVICGARVGLAAESRPNFLFVYTDDQRFDAMSVVQKEQGEAGRFPWLKTPNQDRLAAGGVRFRNAFVVNSLCAPSRANFLTGRYSHLNGVANNHTPFPTDSVTWSTELRKAGYTTGYFGKWHMGSQSGQRPGFDFSASFVGQGRYIDCPIEVNGKSTPSSGWVDDVTTDYALNFIRQNKDKPFGLVMGFKACHGPWEPPERHKNDLPDAVSKPATNTEARPPYLSKPAADNARPADVEKQKNAGAVVGDRSAMQRNYFRTILGADDNLGKLLDLLDELKLADNTVVVFCSDNGYYLGDHGLGDKRSAYDESMRIPMIVRYPKLAPAGVARDEMVLNIDIAATFMDLAGVLVPKDVQGRSLRPLLSAEKNPDWRKAWLYEYFFERGYRVPTILAVRTDTSKLVKYPGHDDWTELFDLKADPFEKKNLFADPEAADLRKQLESEFDKQAKAVDFKIPSYADGVAPPADAAAPAVPTGSKHPAPNRYVLNYDFTAGQPAAKPGEVDDVSTLRNNGRAVGTKFVDGRGGKKALQFDGQASIDIPKSPSLNPAGSGWSVQVVCKAEKPDGVLFASGGISSGYALFLEGGLPTFVVNAANKSSKAQGKAPIVGDWHRLMGVIQNDGQIVLFVDGKKAGSAPLTQLIIKEPNDGMQVGIDQRSPVAPNPKPFVGLIESVEVFSGVLVPKE